MEATAGGAIFAEVVMANGQELPLFLIAIIIQKKNCSDSNQLALDEGN